MRTLNNFSVSSETELRSFEMKLIRGGSGGSGGILQDEDILIPDPEPGDKQE